MVYRIGETSGEQTDLMKKQVCDFDQEVAIKKKKKLDEVTVRLDKPIDA